MTNFLDRVARNVRSAIGGESDSESDDEDFGSYMARMHEQRSTSAAANDSSTTSTTNSAGVTFNSAPRQQEQGLERQQSSASPPTYRKRSPQQVSRKRNVAPVTTLNQLESGVGGGGNHSSGDESEEGVATDMANGLMSLLRGGDESDEDHPAVIEERERSRMQMPDEVQQMLQDRAQNIHDEPLSDNEGDGGGDGIPEGGTLRFLSSVPLAPLFSGSSHEGAYDPDEEYAQNESSISQEELESLGLINDQRTVYQRMNDPRYRVHSVYFAFRNLPDADRRSVLGDGDGQSNESLWHWLNHFVSRITQYIHCEMVFILENTRNNTYSRFVSSIHRSHELRMTKKEYKRQKLKYWDFYHYDCSEAERKSLFDYERESNRRPFNKVAFMWNFLVPNFLRVDYRGERVFCSEQICLNLRACDSSRHCELVPYAVHPADLKAYMLKKNGRKFRRCQEPTEQQPNAVYL